MMRVWASWAWLGPLSIYPSFVAPPSPHGLFLPHPEAEEIIHDGGDGNSYDRPGPHPITTLSWPHGIADNDYSNKLSDKVTMWIVPTWPFGGWQQ